MIALVGVLAASACAEGLTWQQLQAHGWACFPPPGSIDRIVCFDPGVGRPLPRQSRPCTVVQLRAVQRLVSEVLSRGHFIRADLYAGQRCGNEPYVFRALIGYYECVHT